MIRYEDVRPGEVWLCMEPMYLSNGQAWSIHPSEATKGPFIVTWVSTECVGIVMAGRLAEPHVDYISRGVEWTWQEHMTRLWPEPPSWKELGRDPGDFRSEPCRQDPT